MRYIVALNAVRAGLVTRPALVAPNSFKGTLTAAAAAQAIAAGVHRAWPGIEVHLRPLADGGDGFLATLLAVAGGHRSRHRVSGPLGAPVRAPIGWLPDRAGESAVIELASACGLTLLAAPGPESAARSSSRGLGELIRQALERRPARILVGLGGSACTDGGAGMAQALGYQLLDQAGAEVGPGGVCLQELERIESASQVPDLGPVEVIGACDVTNPLLGPGGAAATFAPQKGADLATVQSLEQGLRRLAEVADRDLGWSDASAAPGSGAAGGTGFGLIRFCGAKLESGAALVARATGLDQALEGCGAVFTGEGRFDLQSLAGKATGEVVRRAAERGLPCVVLAGSAEPDALSELLALGGLFVPIGSPPGPSGVAAEAAGRLTEATARACRQLFSG